MAFLFLNHYGCGKLMSKEVDFYDSGFGEFEKMMKEYAEKVSEEKALDAIEAGAQEFVNDLLRLPRPRSRITKAGYTHIIGTFALERTESNIKVGWGKYYGPMLEHGTRKMAARAHLKPLFEQNKEKYYKKMTECIFG